MMFIKRNKRGGKRKKRLLEREIMALLVVAFFIIAFLSSTEEIPNDSLAIIIVVVIVAIFSIAIKLMKRRLKTIKYDRSDMKKIDDMNGREFEEYLAMHFEQQGYRTKLTPKSNDYGADLILNKNGEKTVVQAKRYGNSVGNSAIQEVLGAKGYYNASKGMVISNSYFTANAKALAEANNVELWDREKLIKMFGIRT